MKKKHPTESTAYREFLGQGDSNKYFWGDSLCLFSEPYQKVLLNSTKPWRICRETCDNGKRCVICIHILSS
jgi:hypothetical protein